MWVELRAVRLFKARIHILAWRVKPTIDLGQAIQLEKYSAQQERFWNNFMSLRADWSINMLLSESS